MIFWHCKDCSVDRVCAVLNQCVELLVREMLASGAVPALEEGHLSDGQVALGEADLVIFNGGFVCSIVRVA